MDISPATTRPTSNSYLLHFPPSQAHSDGAQKSTPPPLPSSSQSNRQPDSSSQSLRGCQLLTYQKQIMFAKRCCCWFFFAPLTCEILHSLTPAVLCGKLQFPRMLCTLFSQRHFAHLRMGEFFFAISAGKSAIFKLGLRSWFKSKNLSMFRNFKIMLKLLPEVKLKMLQ